MTHIVSKTFQLNKQPLTFFHAENDDTIFGTLSCLQHGKFHLEEVKFAPGDVFVDIGCNVGLLSLVIAAVNPQIRVLAFDASPLAIACLKRSAAENKLPNIEAYQVAIGDQSAKDVSFFSNGKDVSCLVRDGLNTSNNTFEAKANVIAVDDIFDSPLLGVDNVRYLKLDVEGQEYSIFNRLFDERKDLLPRIDYLHLEIHPYAEYGPEELERKVRAQWGERVFFDT